MPDQPLTYQKAGVDIREAERALGAVHEAIRSTYNERVLSGVGGFGGLFSASFPDLDRPVLVSSIDGVGTKTKVAAMVGQFSGLGHDIVNHCANDILCQGARPLFFLDYFGCSRLNAQVFEQVVVGAAEACQALDCALIGGETAEMPGVYGDEEVDIVGSMVGVVDESKRLPNGKPQPGDVILGLASSGLHTNGYSLARRALFEVGGLSVRDPLPSSNITLGDALLIPHRCYVPSVGRVLEEFEGVFALAHITGGGFYGNIPRVLPSDCQALLDRRAWAPPPLFRLIQEAGSVPDTEMFHTFNMGIGMVLIVRKDASVSIMQRLIDLGELAAPIGEIQQGAHDVQII